MSDHWPTLRTLSFDALDRLSIRLGCETSLNEAADTELKRRGYVFNAHEQRWERPTIHESEKS